MSCTTASCTVPVRLPSGDAVGNSLADLRVAASMRRKGKATALLVRVPVGASGISAPEGTEDAAACGCSAAHDGPSASGCGGDGCGPSCGCGPCKAQYGNAEPVATTITAMSLGYPAGPAAMLAARARGNLARAELARKVAAEIKAEEVAPSAGPGWERAMRESGSYPARTVVLLGLTPGARVYADGIMGQDITSLPTPTGDAAQWIERPTLEGTAVNAWTFGTPDGTSSLFVRTPDGEVYTVRLPTLNAGLPASGRVTTINMLPMIAARATSRGRMTVAERIDALAKPWDSPTVSAYGLATMPSGAPHGYAPGQWNAMSAQTREAARLMDLARPSGALSAPVRRWDQLSDTERVILLRAAGDRARANALGLAPSGLLTAPPEARALGYNDMSWSALGEAQRTAILAGQQAQSDAPPAWAVSAGITPATWRTMTPAAREAARQSANAPGQGWAVANGIITGATGIVNSVLAGDLQRQLAQIAASAQVGVAQQQAAAANFVAQSNQRIAELQLAAAQAAAQGAPAQAAQFQSAIAAVQQAQTAAQNQNQQNMSALSTTLAQLAQNQQNQQNQPRPSDGGISPTMLGLGALGLGAVYLVTRKR